MGDDLKPILEDIAAQLKRRNDTVDKQLAQAEELRKGMFSSFPFGGGKSEDSSESSEALALTRFDPTDFSKKMNEDHERTMSDFKEQAKVTEENTAAFRSELIEQLRRIGDELKRIGDLRG